MINKKQFIMGCLIELPDWANINQRRNYAGFYFDNTGFEKDSSLSEDNTLPVRIAKRA